MKKILLVVLFLTIFYSVSNSQNKIRLNFGEGNQLKAAANILINDLKRIDSKIEISISNAGAYDGPQIIIKTDPKRWPGGDIESFSIKQIDTKTVEICGKTDRATELAVYEYLEQVIGVCWLMPSDLWTEYPEKITSIYPKKMIVSSPSYLSREISPFHTASEASDETKWYRKNKFGGRIKFHHNLNNIYKSAGSANYFVTKNKKSFRPDWKSNDSNWQIDFNSKDAENYAVKKITDYFKVNKSMQSFSLGINDNTNFGGLRNTGKNSLSLDNYSDVYYRWVNNVVKDVNNQIPNKKFGLLAYLNVTDPPSFQLATNVVPYIAYESTILQDRSAGNMVYDLLGRWNKKASSFGIYDYVYGYTYVVPRPNYSLISSYIKNAKNLGAEHYYAEYYPGWVDGPKAWLIGKLTWNSTLDYRALLDIWYSKAFGMESASCMKEFYELWEKVWTDQIYGSKWWNKRWIYLKYADVTYLDNINKDTYEKSLNLLNKSINLSSTDRQKKRLQYIKDLFVVQRLYFYYYKKLKLPDSGHLPTKGDVEKAIKSLGNNSLNVTYIKSLNNLINNGRIN